jgi:hypothetical protein
MRDMGKLRPAVDVDPVCADLFRPADLMFLLHAAADRMAAELDKAAIEIGLNDARDWLVLAALDGGQ